MPLDQFSGAIDGFQSPEYFGPRDRHGEALPIQRLDLRQRVHTVGARFDENAARPCERPEMALQLAHRLEGFVTGPVLGATRHAARSEEHTSELQSLMRISYAVFCLKKKKTKQDITTDTNIRCITYKNEETK